MSLSTRQYIWKTSPNKFIAVVSIINAIFYNIPLYRFALNNIEFFELNGALTIFTLFILVFFITSTFLCLLFLISKHVVKPFCILIALINSIAIYFVISYQVVLDKSMMGNILNSNIAEAESYLHFKALLYFLLLGVVPSWMLLSSKIVYSSRLKLVYPLLLVPIFSIFWFYLTSTSWLWIDQHAKKLGGSILPWSYIVNMARYQNEINKVDIHQELLPKAKFVNNTKTVVILIIGESARAQNFSLYDYKRETNPLMNKLEITALNNTTACSTYTTASISCMLSHTDSRKLYEPLPSYLQRHGIDVIWRTNNWGEPSIKVNEYKRDNELRKTCSRNDCDYDGVLLTNLSERIKNSKSNKVFVTLHQSGSHGPAYYSKYPKRFEKFLPVCDSVELSQCTNEQLINAYDNSILYTDYFVSETIDILKKLKETSTMLLYISDHGESLGEHGLYLHGTPLSIAPSFQKKIPFILWTSRAFRRQKNIVLKDFNQRKKNSHQNIFHSIMGAFDMNSRIYNATLDIFSKQRDAS